MINLQEAAAILRPREAYPDEWDNLSCPHCHCGHSDNGYWNDNNGPTFTCAACKKGYDVPDRGLIYVAPDFTLPNDASRALLLWYCLEWIRRHKARAFVLNATCNSYADKNHLSTKDDGLLDTARAACAFAGMLIDEDNGPEILYAAIKETADAH